MDYKFESETLQILEIKNEIEAIQNKISNFCYKIETEDTEKLVKQIKTVKNTCNRIFNHLSSLNTDENLQTYIGKISQKEKAEKVAKLLQHSNFLEYVSLNMHCITNDELVAFQEYYNVRLSEAGYGTFRWLNVWYNGHHITEEDMIELGIRPKITKTEEDYKEKYNEEKDEEVQSDCPYDHFGWMLPNGDFYPSDFGTHEESAVTITETMKWEEEYNSWKGIDGLKLHRDFLVYVKGAILLHNPCGLGGVMVTQHKPATKAQREAIYDYFIHRGDKYMAKQYLEEE